MTNISSSFQTSVSFSYFNYQVFFIALTQIIDSSWNLTSKSEKLSDISEYEENKNKLNAQEQVLIQRMHINHDWYLIQSEKIAYAEFCLKIRNRTHNLMSYYYENDLYIFLILRIWWEELYNIYENYFEKENAWKYFYDILKQSFLIFNEYYNLFFRKKKHSHLKDSSLIDAMKKNINYNLIMRIINYRMINEFKSKIFSEHVEMYQKIDWELH